MHFNRIKFVLVMVVLGLLPGFVHAQAWYATPGWLYRKAITIDYTKVGAGPHTDFPVLISRSDTDLQTKAQADGDDILFTSSDGTTKLAHEIESYTSASGTIVAWVKIPSLSSSANTIVYMYYGNSAATAQQNITGTWNTNFKGVWHLNGVFTDSTSNAANGTNSGTTAGTGKISDGRVFAKAVPASISINGLMGSPANATLSAWGNLTSRDTTGAHIINIGDYLSINVDDAIDGYLGSYYNAGWGLTKSAPKLNPAGSGWHYFVYKFDDAANVQVLYMDGVQVGSGAFPNSISYTTLGTNTFIGKHGNGNANYDFDGTIDEVRVSDTPRSAGWILSEYNNQNSPSTFYTVSGEAKIYYSRVNGNWNTPASWSNTGHAGTASSTAPGNSAADIVVIGNSNTITLDVNVTNQTEVNVNSTGTLNMGTNTIGGSGPFILNSGGTLGVGSTAGITSAGATGNVQTTGTRTFSTGANYNYNGSSAQVSGNGLPATVNNLTIGNSAGVTLSASVAVNSSLTVSGTLQLAGFPITSGDLQGAGIITSSSLTPTLATGSNNTSTTFSGVIGTGAIALTKNGTGILTLSGSNTYTGITTVAAGTLKLNNTNALGTTAGATSVTSGAVLDLNGINYSNAETLTLNGTGISSGGALINSSSTAASYAGNITLSVATPTITANNPITLSGVISGGNTSGANSLTVAGNSTLTGALTLSGNNTYTGFTIINSGALLKIGANNALGAGAPNGATDPGDGNSTIINSGGVLDLNGITYTGYEGLRMNGTGFAAAGSGCIINSSSTAAIYSGYIDTWTSSTITAANPITFNGGVQVRNYNSLTKAGSDTLTLAPTGGDRSSNTSIIIVSAGTLKLGANLTETGSSTVYTRVNSGAVLDLNGYICSRYLYLNGTGSGNGALINSGTATTHSGLVTLESASSIAGGTGTIAITGTVSGAGFGLTLGGAAGGSVTSVISGILTTVTKAGAGTWTLSGLNTYTGATTVSAGILRATNNTIVASTDGAFGNNAGGLFLNGGTIQSDVTTFSRPLVVTGTNSGLDAYGSARTISSTITLTTAGTFNLNVGGFTAAGAEGQNLTLAGVISYTTGTLSLTKIGTSNVSFGTQTVTLLNLTLSAGALTSTSSSLNLAGNFSNNASFTHGSGTVNFNGTGTNTVTGSSTTAFNTITVNKGTDYSSNVLDVQSLITMTAGGLTLTNGTFKLSSASTIIPFTADIPTAPYLIPSTAGLWCNGGTISPSTTNWSVDGLLRVTSGTVTVGNASTNILGPKPSSSIMVEGGNLYITGRVSNPGFPWTFNMTGGTMTINTMGTATANRPPFYMDQSASSFSMSGGTMVIERAGGSAGQNLGFHSLATAGSGFTGGTLQIGNASTPASQIIGITSTNPIYNLTINSANATAQITTSALTVTNDVTITAGVLNANNLNLSVGGSWINNASTSAFTGGTATMTMNGSAAESIGGSFSTTFNNLTIAASNTITANVNSTVSGNLLVSSGTLDLGSFTANRGSAGGTLTVSDGATIRIGGTNTLPSNYSTHSIGATSTIEYGGTSQAVAILNNSQDYGHLTISGSGTKTLVGSENVGGTLTLTSGTITTGASNLYLKAGGSVARTSGHVVGNFRKNIATGVTSKTFEIGDATNYTPVTVAFSSVTTAGDLTASVVSGDHANIATSTINPSKSVNRNWTLNNSGIAFTNYNAAFTFVGGDVDGGAATSTFIVGEYSSGWTYPTVGTRTATTTEATGLTTFGDFQLGETVSPPSVLLVNSVAPLGLQPPGTDLVYTLVFTNDGSNPAQLFVVIDPIPVNTDFKLGSAGTVPGTTGLTVAIAFSNDNGASFTYTPVSSGGGAPAGYDGNVTHIRWTFSGNLSHTPPNNSGSIFFTARIR